MGKKDIRTADLIVAAVRSSRPRQRPEQTGWSSTPLRVIHKQIVDHYSDQDFLKHLRKLVNNGILLLIKRGATIGAKPIKKIEKSSELSEFLDCCSLYVISDGLPNSVKPLCESKVEGILKKMKKQTK